MPMILMQFPIANIPHFAFILLLFYVTRRFQPGFLSFKSLLGFMACCTLLHSFHVEKCCLIVIRGHKIQPVDNRVTFLF